MKNEIKQSELLSLVLLKRFDYHSTGELVNILTKQYATEHFDITTVMLLVERILKDLALSPKQIRSLTESASKGATRCTYDIENDTLNEIRTLLKYGGSK